jgi:hypothetical protein
MWTQLLCNDTYTNISNSLRNITRSDREVKQDTRLTFGMYTFPFSVIIGLHFLMHTAR